MINSANLTGRLTRDVDLKYTSGGVAIANFTLAVDRSFKSANGERETDFINCVAFRKTAEIMANHLRKGSLIGVTGRIQTRNYENNAGQKVYVTEIVAENFAFLESKRDQQSNQSAQQNNQNTYSAGSPDPFAKSGDPIDISDDDLPF